MLDVSGVKGKILQSVETKVVFRLLSVMIFTVLCQLWLKSCRATDEESKLGKDGVQEGMVQEGEVQDGGQVGIEDEVGVQHGIEEEGGVQVGIHSSLSVSPNPTPPAPSLHLQPNPLFLFPCYSFLVITKRESH